MAYILCRGVIDHLYMKYTGDLSVPSICFVCVFVYRKLSPHLGWITGVCPLMLLLWVILHTMWSDKSMQLLCLKLSDLDWSRYHPLL